MLGMVHKQMTPTEQCPKDGLHLSSKRYGTCYSLATQEALIAQKPDWLIAGAGAWSSQGYHLLVVIHPKGFKPISSESFDIELIISRVI